MKKMIIFLSLLVISFVQINYKSSAQTTFPNPTSDPGNTGPIEAGGICPGADDCGGFCCPKNKCPESSGDQRKKKCRK